MPSDNAIRLAEIFDAAMDEAGLELVQRGTAAPAPMPTGPAPVTPAPSPVPAQPAPAPAPAQPRVSTYWAWDGSMNTDPARTLHVPYPGPSVNPGAAPSILFPLIPPAQQCLAEVPGYFREGDDCYCAFEVSFFPGYPAGATSYQLFTELKNDGVGTAPVELGVRGGQFEVSGGLSHPSGNKSWSTALGPCVADGRWYEFQLHSLFSTDPDRAVLDVWIDRRPVLQNYHPRGGTLYPGMASYHRLGQNAGMRSTAASVAFRGMRWGRVV